MSAQLDEEQLEFLKAARRALSLKQVSRESGLRYTVARRVLHELSGVVAFRFLVNFPVIKLMPAALLASGGCPTWLACTFVSKLEGEHEFQLCLGLAPAKKVLWGEQEENGVLRGLELVFWDPSGFPLGRARRPSEEDYALPEEPRVYALRPDVVDAALLSFKLDAPFLRVFTAYGRARSLDDSLPNLTTQAVEYHFKRHVKPAWTGNAAYLLIPDSSIPVQVYLVEGWRSCALARVTSTLTGYRFALLDKKRALIVSQFPAREKVEFYRAVRALEVRNVYGELIVPPGEAAYKRPLLWKSLREGGWSHSFECVDSPRPVFP